MKRERIEDLGCIKILIEQILDHNIFEYVLGQWSCVGKDQEFDHLIESYNHMLADLCDLKNKLKQIQDYAKGFEDYE